MKFVPNYITKDKVFEVMIDKATLENKPLEDGTYLSWWHNKEITQNKITVYNRFTQRVSEKSIYYNEKKGFYFKGNSSYWTKTPHSRYYINDLEVLRNDF